ncbi:MAG: hypothetical protein WBY94_01785 [Polyangiaceae bacterium]
MSSSTGGVTITNTALFTNNVPSGATGFTSCSAGDFVQGNGTSPLECNSIPSHDVVISNGTSGATGINLLDSQILIGQTSTNPAGASLSGDVTMTDTGAVTLTHIRSNAVANVAPGGGQFLAFNGGTLAWTPTTISYPNAGYFTGSSGSVTTSPTVLASGTFTIGSSGSALLNVSYECANGDSLTTNQLTLGLCVDCTGAIPGGIQAGGFASGVAGSNITNASDVINPSGLTAASHTFNILAETAVTPSVNMACTAKASIRY